MKRRLVLLRHAKSDWSVSTAADHERPLNQRGRLAATLMGAWLSDQPWRLDAALVSTALRTRETWSRVRIAAEGLGVETPEPVFDRALYEVGALDLLKVLRRAPNDAVSVIIVGHNPGLEDLAALLATPDRPAPGAFATATAAVFEAELGEDGWAASGPAAFRLIAVERPKSLV